ncbi:MAG: hypothetical protein AMJ72_01940 [Acidithiobacillales bacterium SM1_46]|nr:MAG: hypothetical protein AMJ72_01940 [Acidithiobacillales bacterium SM1_46]
MGNTSCSKSPARCGWRCWHKIAARISRLCGSMRRRRRPARQSPGRQSAGRWHRVRAGRALPTLRRHQRSGAHRH